MSMQKRESAILRAFSNLGKTNGMAPPPYTSNLSAVADELFVADMVRSLANKRYEMAKAEAAQAGILGDLDDSTPGTRTTFSEDGISIVVRRAADSTTLDKNLLVKNLTEVLGSALQAADIVAKSSKPRKGATTIIIGHGE